MTNKMQKITPCLWFNSDAEEAVRLYVSVFPNSKIGHIERYGKSGAEVSGMKVGQVMTISFTINGENFMALNGGPAFKFSEAVSFMIECENQKEVNHYYNKLSHDPKAEICGWLKDKFGLSWQIIPKGYDKMMASLSPSQKERAMAAMLKMKRLNLEELNKAALAK